MKKRIFIFVFALMLMFLNINSAFANCSECDVDSCESCGCILNDAGTKCIYQNYDANALKSCGNGMMNDIPSLIPKVISIAYNVIQIAVPIILVIMGSLDLFKGISASKEDEIKKGQQMFIKRLIAAALVFFAFVITKILISIVADGTEADILECAECFIKNDCDANVR